MHDPTPHKVALIFLVAVSAIFVYGFLVSLPTIILP